MSLNSCIETWNKKFASIFANPLEIGGNILIGDTSGAIAILDSINGNILWMINIASPVIFTPLIHHAKKILIVPAQNELLLININLSTISVLFASIDGNIASSPTWKITFNNGKIILNNKLCFCSSNGTIHVGLLDDLNNLTQIISENIGGEIFSSPVWVNKSLTFGTRSNYLIILDQD